MGTVDKHLRQNLFHAPGPEAGGNPLSDVQGCNTFPLIDGFYRTHGKRCVLHLIRCNRPDAKFDIFIIPSAHGKINAFILNSQEPVVLFRHRLCLYPKFQGSLLKNFRNPGRSAPVDTFRARLHDARLLGRNLFDGVSQIRHMVEADMGDYRQFLLRHGIGRIQPSAQTGLQNTIIGRMTVKQDHADEKNKLEKGRMIPCALSRLRPVQSVADSMKSA